jgi:hypothetical protein
MARMTRTLLTVAILGGILAMPETHAQGPSPAPPATAPRAEFSELVGDLPSPLPGGEAVSPENAWQPEFLRTLPRPPDQPRSLLQPALPPPPPPPHLVH